MPASLNAEGDGWACPEHPTYAPKGLTSSHAQNSLAKHNREHHDAAQQDVADLEEFLREHVILGDLHPMDYAILAEEIVERGYARTPF